MFGTLLLLTVTFMDVMGFGPIEAGLAMLGMRLTQAGWARVTAHLVDAIGVRRTHAMGLAGMAVGCASLTRIGASPAYVADILPGLLVLGRSAPFVLVSGSMLALQCTRPADSGLASGILGSSQWLGGSLSVAAVSALLVAHGDGATGGIRAGFGLCAILAVSAVVLVGLATRSRPAVCRLA